MKRAFLLSLFFSISSFGNDILDACCVEAKQILGHKSSVCTWQKGMNDLFRRHLRDQYQAEFKSVMFENGLGKAELRASAGGLEVVSKPGVWVQADNNLKCYAFRKDVNNKIAHVQVGSGHYQPQPTPWPGYNPYPSKDVCRLELTGNYYYISKNGNLFSKMTPDLSQALGELNELSYAGVCRPAQPKHCGVESIGTMFYVSREKERISAIFMELYEATAALQEMRAHRVCY